MAILYVGIDLAKNVFAVHGVDGHGKLVLVWARLFAAHAHTVRLIAPKFVTPYRMSGARGKNDAADAAAICEAVQRPAMRFVPVKSIDQQARLIVHRARQGFVEARAATINRVRGLLSELGIVLPLKAAAVRREAMIHTHVLKVGAAPCAARSIGWPRRWRGPTAAVALRLRPARVAQQKSATRTTVACANLRRATPWRWRR